MELYRIEIFQIVSGSEMTSTSALSRPPKEFICEVRLVPSVAVFKKKLLSIIRPPAKSVFGIHDPLGLSYLSAKF